MTKQPQELSYFRLRLQDLLNSSFPEKSNDETFIYERSELAAEAYEGAFKAGYTPGQSSEIANIALFEGLYFSKFDTVFKVVCNEFDSLMADEALRPFALKMFPVCEPVFAGYELTDDFEGTREYNLLYTELTGAIVLWIEENGINAD